MDDLIKSLIKGLSLSGDIGVDSYNLFLTHNQPKNAGHCKKVADIASNLAVKYGYDKDKARIAGLLHDIGEIIPADKMVDAAKCFGLEVFKEESEYPIILHQKLSRCLSSEIFSITDSEVLNAIECHTTLKAEPSSLDMILFISDKLSWDSRYNSLFLHDVQEGLGQSVEKGCFAYLKYLFDKGNMKVVHPWTLEAFNFLMAKV